MDVRIRPPDDGTADRESDVPAESPTAVTTARDGARCGEAGRRLLTDGGSEDDTVPFTGTETDDTDNTAVFEDGRDETAGDDDGQTRVFDGADTTDSSEWTPSASISEKETEVRYDDGLVDDESRSAIERWFTGDDLNAGLVLSVVIGLLSVGGTAIYLGWAGFLAVVVVVGLLFALGVYGLLEYN